MVALFAFLYLHTSAFTPLTTSGATSSLNMVPRGTSVATSNRGANPPLHLFESASDGPSPAKKKPFTFSFASPAAASPSHSAPPTKSAKSDKLSVDEEAYLSRQVQIMVKLKSERDRLKSMLDRDPTEEEVRVWVCLVVSAPRYLDTNV